MELALTPIIEQLRGAGCAQVEGVLELSGQETEPRRLPAYFVVPTDESAQPNANSGTRDQAVDVGFQIFIVVDGARRNKAGISEELREQTRRVKDALVGWTHPQASRPCDYAGGRLVSASGSTVVWAVRLRTRYHERKAK